MAWSRLGSSYSPAELDTALANRTLLELRAMIRPNAHASADTLAAAYREVALAAGIVTQARRGSCGATTTTTGGGSG